MSETTNPYAEMAYNDLKKMASERGLDPKGTKDELMARLLDADNGVAGNNSDTDGDEGGAEGTNEEGSEGGEGDEGEGEKNPEPPKRSTRTAPTAPRMDIETKYRTKAMMTKAALEKQPKVMVFIPFEAGENAAMAAKVKQTVNINGYQFDVPRGVAVEVPKQVAEMIKERLESEGKAGRAYRIDSDERKQEALS